MKKILTIITLLITIFLIGCLPTEYNLRAIYDSDRNYISADSTSYNMSWNNNTWVKQNAKYWSSAGLIITNEYNIFEENKWLQEIVDNGFEGQILLELQPEIIIESWGSEDVGTFKRDYYDAQANDLTNNIVKLISNGTDVVINDAIIGNYRLIKTTVMEPEPYRNSISTVLNDYFSALHTSLDSPTNITYGLYIKEYNYRFFNKESLIDTSDIDPAELGYALNVYTNNDLDTHIHAFYDNIITSYNLTTVIVSGDRLLYDASMISNYKLSGYLFNNVTSTNADSVVTFANTLRGHIDPAATESSLMFIAGIKTGHYQSNPAQFAKIIEKLINGGIYFTPGGNNEYFGYPNGNIGQWWIRTNDDSNWVHHHMNPTYASINETPRRLLNRFDSDLTAPNILLFTAVIDTTTADSFAPNILTFVALMDTSVTQ